MNFATIKNLDVANGEGLRVSLFVSGCNIHCKGCFNKVAWDFDYGEKFDKETLSYLLGLIENPYISGLSILGGEPMDIKNQSTVANIIWFFKKSFPEKTVWLWTGYKMENIPKTPFTEYILNTINVLVDGEFREEEKNLNLQWRGSENQTVRKFR